MGSVYQKVWLTYHSHAQTKLKIPHFTEVILIQIPWQGCQAGNLTDDEEAECDVQEIWELLNEDNSADTIIVVKVDITTKEY